MTRAATHARVRSHELRHTHTRTRRCVSAQMDTLTMCVIITQNPLKTASFNPTMRMVAVSVRCSDRIGSASTFARAPTPRQRCVPSAACGCVPEMVDSNHDPENDHGQKATRLRLPPHLPDLCHPRALRLPFAHYSTVRIVPHGPHTPFLLCRSRTRGSCAAQVCLLHEDQGAAGVARQLHQAAATVRAGQLRTGAATDANSSGSNE